MVTFMYWILKIKSPQFVKKRVIKYELNTCGHIDVINCMCSIVFIEQLLNCPANETQYFNKNEHDK